MAELNTKENEVKEVVKEITAKPTVLSEDQVDFFTGLIKDNSPYLQEEISRVKTDFLKLLEISVHFQILKLQILQILFLKIFRKDYQIIRV